MAQRGLIYVVVGLAVIAVAGFTVGIYFALRKPPQPVQIQQASPTPTPTPVESSPSLPRQQDMPVPVPVPVMIDLYNQMDTDPVRKTANVEPRDEYRWPKSAVYYDQRLGPMLDRFDLIDGPTERVLRRPKDPVGPWERVGAMYQQTGTVTSMLPLFGRKRGTRNRYDYRTVFDDVPLPIAENVQWITENEQISVDPLGTFSVIMYDEYV
jgi:hypothetical protein